MTRCAPQDICLLSPPFHMQVLLVLEVVTSAPRWVWRELLNLPLFVVIAVTSRCLRRRVRGMKQPMKVLLSRTEVRHAASSPCVCAYSGMWQGHARQASSASTVSSTRSSQPAQTRNLHAESYFCFGIACIARRRASIRCSEFKPTSWL